MTSLDTQLWELIKTHKMPDDAAGRPFIDQLMAEHRISHDTATVAIAEYRKFMYLCATRPERNVPSKAVDLVWHLHLQHSRDYWDVFCKKLGKPVHHTPGAAGSGHLQDYKTTVRAYGDLFGTPPKGIWKQSDTAGAVVGMAFSAMFIAVGVSALLQGGAPLFALTFIAIPLIVFTASLRGLTERGQITLIFDCSEPFADGNAGDCSSGDCGGCGD